VNAIFQYLTSRLVAYSSRLLVERAIRLAKIEPLVAGVARAGLSVRVRRVLVGIETDLSGTAANLDAGRISVTIYHSATLTSAGRAELDILPVKGATSAGGTCTIDVAEIPGKPAIKRILVLEDRSLRG
jgi:hypothetical protein